MNSKIKAVIFDVGGVLALEKSPLQKYKGRYHNLGVHEYISKKLNISLDQYFDAILTTYAKSVEGKLPESVVIKTLCIYLGITHKKLRKLYKKAYRKNFKKNKQLFKQAFKLKKLGYKIAVLSDQWHLSYETLMPKKYYKKFDTVVVSCDVGIRKPDPRIYFLALKKLKVNPNEGLFIDNQRWNTEPAKKLGMKTIVFRNNNQLFRNKLWTNLFK